MIDGGASTDRNATRKGFADLLTAKQRNAPNRRRLDQVAKQYAKFENYIARQELSAGSGIGGREVRPAMRVYLDDERPTPEGWTRVYWPGQAIALLETGLVEEISLDHDLGDDAQGTGYDVILWIEEAVALRGFKPPKITVHSANPSARDKMVAGISAIVRLAEGIFPDSET